MWQTKLELLKYILERDFIFTQIFNDLKDKKLEFSTISRP